MKKFVIAAGLLAVAATAAGAQDGRGWEKGRFPYAQKNHSVCQDKARRLHGFEARAKADGRLTRSERNTMALLQRDLDRTCGRFRWNG